MTETLTTTTSLADRVRDVLAKDLLDQPFPGPQGGWTVVENEHGYVSLQAGIDGTFAITLRIDVNTRRLTIHFYGHRSFTSAAGNRKSVYARDLFTHDDWDKLVLSATVAGDASAARLATGLRKVIPSALVAFEKLEEWSWRQATAENRQLTSVAAINAALGTVLAPHASRDEVSCYVPDGHPLQALFGKYVRVVVGHDGEVRIEGARLHADTLDDALAALTVAANTFIKTTTARG